MPPVPPAEDPRNFPASFFSSLSSCSFPSPSPLRPPALVFGAGSEIYPAIISPTTTLRFLLFPLWPPCYPQASSGHPILNLFPYPVASHWYSKAQAARGHRSSLLHVTVSNEPGMTQARTGHTRQKHSHTGPPRDKGNTHTDPPKKIDMASAVPSGLACPSLFLPQPTHNFSTPRGPRKSARFLLGIHNSIAHAIP